MHAGLSKDHSPSMFNKIAKTYDPLNRILSMGIDKGWRKKMRKNLPTTPNLEILDLATGTADVPLALIKAPHVARIQGLDLSEGMIQVGRRKIADKQLQDKIKLNLGDGVQIPQADDQYHAVTLSFGIRNFPDAQKSLSNIFRVLKPGGRALILEFSLPKNRIFRAFYLFYLRRILPTIGGIFSGNKQAYSYLNQTIETFPYGEDFLEMMRKEGFSNCRCHPLTFGIASLYIGDKT